MNKGLYGNMRNTQAYSNDPSTSLFLAPTKGNIVRPFLYGVPTTSRTLQTSFSSRVPVSALVPQYSSLYASGPGNTVLLGYNL